MISKSVLLHKHLLSFRILVKRTTCDPNPCMNNGHCLIDGLNNIFQCVCQDGYGGSICESKCELCTLKDSIETP